MAVSPAVEIEMVVIDERDTTPDKLVMLRMIDPPLAVITAEVPVTDTPLLELVSERLPEELIVMVDADDVRLTAPPDDVIPTAPDVATVHELKLNATGAPVALIVNVLLPE